MSKELVVNYQLTIDCIHKCYSRLHKYASRRISNRYKQPGEFLLREEARKLRSFVEQMNRSFLLWQEVGLEQLNNPNFHKYLSDVSRLLWRIHRDCNLRLFGAEIAEAFQALYDELIKFIPVNFGIQLSMFDSAQTFHEEVIESKFVHQVFIDFEWVPVLACVGSFLQKIKDKVLNIPTSLTCSKSSWRSVYNTLSSALFCRI